MKTIISLSVFLCCACLYAQDVRVNNRLYLDEFITWNTSQPQSYICERLGAELEELTKEDAELLGVKGGVRIKKIFTPQTPGATLPKAGFVVTHIDGQEIYGLSQIPFVYEKDAPSIKLEGLYDDLLGVVDEHVGSFAYEVPAQGWIQ